MTPDDPRLIDSIKQYLVQRSAAEADKSEADVDAAVARKILQARAAESEPTATHDLGYLARLLAVTGPLVLESIRQKFFAGHPRPGSISDDDQPVPFGTRCAWLAVDSTDTAAVAAALQLHDVRPATWQEGIDGAYGTAIFVTPPLSDWTLAAGVNLFPSGTAPAFIKPLLEGLSNTFGEAQYFCSHKDVELYLWARARKGRLMRAFGWLGERNLTLWNEGGITAEERTVGLLRFPDGQAPLIKDPARKGLVPMDEHTLMQLACLWSIDPTGLDDAYKEPTCGLLGKPNWTPTASPA